MTAAAAGQGFFADPYQLAEMRLAGADAVLLIAAALSPTRLVELHATAALGPALPAGAVLVAESGLTPPDLPVKVCGLTRLVDARLAWDLGAMPPTSTGSPSSAK